MLFKNVLSGALAALVSSRAEPFVQFGRGHYGEHSCEFLLNFGPVVQELSFKKCLRMTEKDRSQ